MVSAGCIQIGRPDGVGQGRRGVDVVVVAVGADHGDHPAAGDALDDGLVVVGGVDDDALLVVAHDPDVVVDVEVLAVDGEGARGDHLVDAGCVGHQDPAPDHDDRAQDLAPLHLGEGLLDLVEADRLAHEGVEVEAALEVEVGVEREVPAGQAVAVPGGLEGPAPAEEVDHGDVDAHLRVGHAHLHHGAGQVAGVEGLLEHRRVADGLDHHVGAEAAGEVADGLDRVDLPRRRRCGWHRSPSPSPACRRRGRRR